MKEKYRENIIQQLPLRSTKEILCTSMEECCELAQAISKYISDYSVNADNLLIKENIAKEMAHVLVCMEEVKQICDISEESIDEWMEEKTQINEKKIIKMLKKHARQIDICEQDIRVCDELQVYITKEGTSCINAIYELWFDADKYFGVNTKDYDDVWINFYTDWYGKGNVKAIVDVSSSDGVISIPWELTPEEIIFFENKMEEYAQRTYEMSLEKLLKEAEE